MYQLEGGIIEYTRQVKAEGLESKFIGKNFVFDQRLGERITDDIVSNCHICGTPCDNHTNCVNDGCHLLFIQCDNCKSKMENCCSADCQTTIHLPLDEQVKLRMGLKNGNKIFKKGKSDALTFRNSNPTEKAVVQIIAPKIKIRKIYIGSATHYYTKANIGQFLIEENELIIGDSILIKGSTTGEQQLILTQIIVDKKSVETAVVGNIVTFKIPFRIRLSDKLYKIV